jgi:hypothetical protein
MTKRKQVSLNDIANELGAYSSGHIAQLKKATLDGIARSMPMLVESSPVDTGLYAQSWSFHAEEWGAILGNYAPHAPIVEYGARPFTPPIAPLLAWAKRVLQDPSQPPEYSKKVWALAIYTQKKITLNGIEPKHVMENAIPAIIDNIRREYERLG